MSDNFLHTLVPLLQSHGSPAFYKRGDTLVHLGESIDRFRIIVSGRAKLTIVSSEGKQLLLCFTRENEILGDLEFFSPGPSMATIQAITDCQTLYLEMEAFRRLVSQSPRLIKVLGQSVAFKLRRANSKLSVNLLYPLKDRLASYLWGLASGTSHEELSGDSLVEIAELMGTSYRHLNRVINQLCQEQILKRTPWGLTIINLPRLELMARNIYLS